MARSFSNSKIVSTFVVDKISIALKSIREEQHDVDEGSKAATTTTSSATTPWVPDPKTGYYRPDNRPNEIDAAQLRQMLLNHKIHQN
ncbi:hypothetical protein LIER_40871 [Lithospermum erythrorhizon]|uniref:Late embryogenesis abundant protein n=1 Tax=Lithospermum erythrorhizon TaxID=34254 RepID=A0AAV3R202_LITER